MKKPSLFERYFTKEIGIEFKACLYFFAILFFYCCYRLYIGLTVAEILHMAEMIFLTYAVGYLQVFVLWNFDEADSIGVKEIVGTIICTAIYSGAAVLCNWFDKNTWVIIGFTAYIIFMYFCAYLVYKYRRKIDDKILNYDLQQFQKEGKSVR